MLLNWNKVSNVLSKKGKLFQLKNRNKNERMKSNPKETTTVLYLFLKYSDEIQVLTSIFWRYF